MCNGGTILRLMRRGLIAFVCFALLAWTIAPTSSHIPTVLKTLLEHSEIVAEHGHSHGLEEDLIWAMHGHSHDVVDHDHSQAVLVPARLTLRLGVTRAEWRGLSQANWSPPLYRLERPPRA